MRRRRRTTASLSILTLLAICVAGLAQGADDAGRAVNGQTGNNGDIRGQVRHSRLSLWRSSIGTLATEPPDTKLQQAVNSLVAAEIAPRRANSNYLTAATTTNGRATTRPAAQPTTQPTPRPTTQPTAQPTTRLAAQRTSRPAAQRTTRPAGSLPASPKPRLTKAAGGGISPQTLGRFRLLSAKDITKPIALADSLYSGGYLQQAYAVYETAERQDITPADHAWVLFQMANCKRTSEPDIALGLYRRLLAENPDSPWSNLAQIRGDILVWNKVNAPRQVLKNLQTIKGYQNTDLGRPAVEQAAQSPSADNPAKRSATAG